MFDLVSRESRERGRPGISVTHDSGMSPLWVYVYTKLAHGHVEKVGIIAIGKTGGWLGTFVALVLCVLCVCCIIIIHSIIILHF